MSSVRTLLGSGSECKKTRAVARSENPGGLVVMVGDDVPTLVEIG